VAVAQATGILMVRSETATVTVGHTRSNDLSDIIYCSSVSVLTLSSRTALGPLCFGDQRSSSARSVLGLHLFGFLSGTYHYGEPYPAVVSKELESDPCDDCLWF
jgi:hypothetical protein